MLPIAAMYVNPDTMGKKAAWQQANPFDNISNDSGGACG
jgi:hypothetical protein